MEIFDIVDEKGIPTGETIERTQRMKKVSATEPPIFGS